MVFIEATRHLFAGSHVAPRDLVTQTEDVLVDTRGYIYVTDKQWGLSIGVGMGPPIGVQKGPL